MLQKWHDASLRAHLLVQTSVALGILIIAFLVTTAQAVNSSTYAALQERIVLAKLMAERMDGQLDHVAEMLSAALNSADLNLEDDDLEPEKRLLSRIYNETDLYKRVNLLDASGQVLWLHPYDASRVGLNLSAPGYVGNFKDAHEPVFVPSLGVLSQSAAVAIYIPIRSATDKILGYLLGWVDLSDSRSASFLYPFEPGSTGYTDVVNEIGRVLASTQPERVDQITDHAGTFGAFIRDGQTHAGSCHSCHAGATPARQTDVLAFAPLNRLPWGVALRQPESEVFANTHVLTDRLAILACVILAVFIGLIWSSTKGIIQPLHRLDAACRQMAGGNLSHPIPVMGQGELSTLASSFEAMRQELADSRQRMEQSQQELESRVEQRTRELVDARDYLLKTNRNLSALNAVAAILSQSLNLTETIDAALQRAMEAIGAECGGIYLCEPGGRSLLAAQRGLSPDIATLPQDMQCPLAQTCRPMDTGVAPERGCRQALAARLHMPSLLCSPLTTKGEVLGSLFIADSRPHHFTAEDETLLVAIGWQLAAAVRNIRLYEELQREERARGKLLHQVIAAQEDERKRIARELHDETSQNITALMLGLDATRMAIHADEKRPNAEKHLLSTRAIAAGMLDSIHRLVADLRPSLLDDLGLLPAIAWYGEKRLKPLHLDLRLESNLQAERLAPPVESTLFRIVQEAMTNIVRHAQASLVSVSLHVQDGCIVLIVADNGQGFRLTPVGYTPADDRGVGLRGMQERAAILGGDCQIRSTPGEGTIITVTIPYPYQAHRTHVPAGVAAAQPSVGS